LALWLGSFTKLYDLRPGLVWARIAATVYGITNLLENKTGPPNDRGQNTTIPAKAADLHANPNIPYRHRTAAACLSKRQNRAYSISQASFDQHAPPLLSPVMVGTIVVEM
jgi:hypothetical protein